MIRYNDLVVLRLYTRADYESQADGRGFITNDFVMTMIITYSIIVIIIV